MSYPIFDRSRLKLKLLSERKHTMTLDDLVPLDAPVEFEHPAIAVLGKRLREAKERGAARILMMGSHVIKQGLSLHIIDLMRRGLISHVAMNGSGPVHDWELAMIGATGEDVAANLADGTFGLWSSITLANTAVLVRYREDGLGESLGCLAEFHLKNRGDSSILIDGFRTNLPVTVHVGIGQDIFAEDPRFDGETWGRKSYRDFLTFAHSVSNLEGGVILNVGSAVMGPEIFMKALAMARNVAHQDGKVIKNFTVGVFDIIHIANAHAEDGCGCGINADATTHPLYFYRPLKTLLVRCGGDSYYVRGDHKQTIPALRKAAIG